MELLALKWNVYSENYTPQFVHFSRSFSVLTLPCVTDNLLNCSRGSQGKNTEAVCHSLLQWTTFWIFIGRTDVQAENPILWPPDVKSWLSGKDPGAGKDQRQEEKGTTEDEMVGWHHRLNGREVAGGWWWTGKPGMLQSMVSQRVRYNWATELDWISITDTVFP